jgi:hypothetical protein
MSSTRHAPEGSPFRQERYASSEAYKTSLNGLQVAARCSLLEADRDLAEILWFLQERSLSDPFCIGGRLGSVEAIAADLLQEANWKSRPVKTWVENWSDPDKAGEWVEAAVDHSEAKSRLAVALREIALNPLSPVASLPGLGEGWRRVVRQYSEKCRDGIKKNLAPTTTAKRVADALRFARETRKLTLIVGRSRLGKSAAAKSFCAASLGMARYVPTPETGDVESFYRAIAKSLGVADAQSYKAADVRDRIERMLMTSRLMLVFDEAQNLFSGLRRVTRQPLRVMWLRRLIDSGVPMAFVALPEFETRIKRCAEQVDWDAAQITDLICRKEELGESLTSEDFEVLVARVAPELSDKAKALVAGSASGQHGAQYVVDTVAVARHTASKANRAKPSDDDVREAIGVRPQFFRPKPTRPRLPKSATVSAHRAPACGAGAVPLRSSRIHPAQPLQAVPGT